MSERPLAVGDPAPDFELPATTGGTVRRSAHAAGAVVLHFMRDVA